MGDIMNYKIKDNYITCSKCGSKIFTAYTEVLSDIKIEIVSGRPWIYFDFVDIKEKSDAVDIECGNCGESISSSYNKLVNDFLGGK